MTRIVILGRRGVVNSALIGIGLIDTPLDILYSKLSIVICLAYILLPVMVLSICTVLQGIDRSLAEQNIEYKSKRASLRLHAPQLHVMKAGWHDAEKEQQGKRLFQSKSILLATVEKDDCKACPEHRLSTATCQDGDAG